MAYGHAREGRHVEKYGKRQPLGGTEAEESGGDTHCLRSRRGGLDVLERRDFRHRDRQAARRVTRRLARVVARWARGSTVGAAGLGGDLSCGALRGDDTPRELCGGKVGAAAARRPRGNEGVVGGHLDSAFVVERGPSVPERGRERYCLGGCWAWLGTEGGERTHHPPVVTRIVPAMANKHSQKALGPSCKRNL